MLLWANPYTLTQANSVTVSSAKQEMQETTAVPPNTIVQDSKISDVAEVVAIQNSETAFPKFMPAVDSTPNAILSRLVTQNPYTWSVGQIVTTTTPLYTITPFNLTMTRNPLFPKILAYYWYFRADLEVHFRLNTNQFYQGLLMFTSVPGSSSGYYHNGSLTGRSWQKPIILSANSEEVVILRLPWLLAVPFSSVISLNTGSSIVPWTIFVDIIAPLRVQSANAPTTLTLTCQTRFVDPQCVFPYSTNAPVLQSGLGSLIKKVTRSRAHHTVMSDDPLDSAHAKPTFSTDSGPGLVMHSLTSALHAVQPWVGLFTSLAGVFDKPNMDNDPVRVQRSTSANWCQSDVKDPSLPLALYRTSYIRTGSELPDGGAWSMQRIASVPCLSVTGTINTGTFTPLAIPLIPPGSPLSLVIGFHKYFHTSFKVFIQFATTTFISVRVLFNFLPTTITATNYVIENNYSQLVEVKGDTNVEFTIPWIFDLYYYRSNVIPSGVTLPFKLIMSVYSPIVVTDTTITPSIDFAIWVSAGPDFQVARPEFGVNNAYAGPNYVPAEQCDITAQFKKQFPSFVEGAQCFADDHQIQSETTLLVTDLLKRYTATAPVNWTAYSAWTLPLDYLPAANTIGNILDQSFIYARGGVMYKANIQPGSSSTPGVSNILWRVGISTSFAPSGQASIDSYDDLTNFEWTVPWYGVVPYIESLTNSTGEFSYCNVYVDNSVSDNTSPTPPFFYVAVRDDYQVGYLVAPNPAITLPLDPKISEKLRPKKRLPDDHSPVAPVPCLGDSAVIKARNLAAYNPNKVSSLLGTFAMLSK
jgi:hypothetical protein